MPDHSASPNWIAFKLSLDIATVKEALDKLKRLGFIEIKDDKIYRTKRPIKVQSKDGNQAIRAHHKQKMKMAAEALDFMETDEREFLSITLPSSKKHLKKAKKLIQEFEKKVIDTFGTNDSEEIYNLSIQYFPLRGKYE